MNKGYTYIDGKVIISDENGNHTQSEYYDNLDQILVQENVIEEMESRIQKLTKEVEKYPEAKKRYIPMYLYSVLGVILIAPPLLVWTLTGINPYLGNIDTVFGSVNQVLFLTLATGSCALPLGLVFTLTDYSKFRDRAKRGKGLNSELEFLKLQIDKEKETLVRLKEEKTRNNENTEFRSTQVNDKQQLEALRSYSELYYVLGYDEKKLSRLYKKGKLDEKLHKYYDDAEIELAKKHLEEKGPVLVKKRNNK